MQTTRRSNLALAGRRLNRIFMDSYNKFSRLTLTSYEFYKYKKLCSISPKLCSYFYCFSVYEHII